MFALVRLQICTCTTAVFLWVNAIYGLTDQPTCRCVLTMLFRFMLFIIECISGEMFTVHISFGATKFFLTRIKTHSYRPLTIFGEGAVSRIIPQGRRVLEINFVCWGQAHEVHLWSVCSIQNYWIMFPHCTAA